MVAPAKPTAQRAAAISSRGSAEKSGRTTTRMPKNPIAAAENRVSVSFSDKINGANMATHKGVENSNTNNCDSGT
jgi:hypothetical protein